MTTHISLFCVCIPDIALHTCVRAILYANSCTHGTSSTMEGAHSLQQHCECMHGKKYFRTCCNILQEQKMSNVFLIGKFGGLLFKNVFLQSNSTIFFFNSSRMSNCTWKTVCPEICFWLANGEVWKSTKSTHL